jgi:hypothetical protein
MDAEQKQLSLVRHGLEGYKKNIFKEHYCKKNLQQAPFCHKQRICFNST